MPDVIRPSETGDRARLKELGFHDGAISSEAGRVPTRIYVIEREGRIAAAAHGVGSKGGDTARLGFVWAGRPTRRSYFRRLLAGLVEEAVEQGYVYGEAEVSAQDTGMLAFLERQYKLKPIPLGREPNSATVRLWLFRVNLVEFLKVLQS